MAHCHCGNESSFKDCCEKFITGKETPKTAESLMRARYSAYATGKVEFVGETHTADGEKFDLEEARRWSKESSWQGLEILNTKDGGEKDDHGIVEFVANYKGKDGTAHHHHEVSEFVKVDGKWLYKTGSIVGGGTIKREGPKVGRNDPCPCGSGKKFKKCCLNQ